MQTESKQYSYHVEGMDCANCALTLERSLEKLSGVQRVRVNFTTTVLEAEGTFAPESLKSHVQKLGYKLSPPERDPSSKPASKTIDHTGVFGFFVFLRSSRQLSLTLVSAVLLLISFAIGLLPHRAFYDGFVLCLHLLVIVLAGFTIGQKGLRALVFGRQITIDLLMSIAAVGALLIGETGEAATVILLFSIGEAIESYTAEQARSSLRSLIALKPDTATLLRPCLDCAEHLGVGGYQGGPCPYCGTHQVVVPVEQVQVGEIALIRPGERIPVDGRINVGASSVNQASVTGESMPVEKSVGDEVYAGTLNGEGALEIEVLHLAQDSTISKIVRLVEEAQSKRAPVERFIDQFAAWYTPIVVTTAILVAVLPPLLFDQPFLDAADGTRGWLYRALALLIVACPCALVISTPVTMVSALTGLARRGVLVKGGVFLDLLARIKVIAFDKTGTLTLGRPSVLGVETRECSPDLPSCEACDELLLLAAAVETRSEHPLAQAVLAEVSHRGLTHRIPDASSVRNLSGRAIEGWVGEERITVGSHTYSHRHSLEHESLHARIESAEREGQTVMLVSRAGKVIGFIGAADKVRRTGKNSLTALKAVDRSLYHVMLTGDHPAAARQVADQFGEGLDEVRAGLLPEEKLGAVETLQRTHGPVAMVGDGVNDSPALAAADVGIAMGGAGSPQAMETADVILMQDDLTRMPDLIKTSRRSRRLIWQNIIFSLGVKLVFVMLTLPGLSTLWMAVFADMGASLLVTLNGMRVLREK
jgi:Cd2+/Zn2+-exporting ATPase